MKYEILEEARRLEGELVGHRRYIHENAELGFELPKTFAYIKDVLEELGIECECVGGGLVCEIGNPEGCVVLLRADSDALPISEHSGEAFSAKNGNMHACGHDMHTAMLLGAARLLKKFEDRLSGLARLIFQPAEEILCGAKEMINAGVIGKKIPDAAIMIHVITARELPVGTVVLSSGGIAAPAAEYFEIDVLGRGTHGARPRGARDALTAASRILLGLEELSAREFLGSDAVITVGKLNGGCAANAIADSAVLLGTLRSYDSEEMECIKDRVGDICDGIGCAFDVRTELKFGNSCPAFRIDEALAAEMKLFVTELVGKEKTITPDSFVGGGSEDFAYFAEKIPSALLAVSAGANDEGLHSPRIRFDESVLPLGAALYAYLAIKLTDDGV